MITQIDAGLYRGPRQDCLESLRPYGIKTVVNLEVGYFEWFHHKAKRERRAAEREGLSYLHNPYDDLGPPSIEKLSSTLVKIRLALKNGPVYFHCLHGVDRTGMVAAAYRMSAQDWTFHKAVEEMKNFGFHQLPYRYLGWIEALHAYCVAQQGAKEILEHPPWRS